MQISLNGLQKKHSLPNEFPYDAINPLSAQTQTFNNIEDVYKTLEECYDKCVEKGFSRLGEALYNQMLYVINDIQVLDPKMQEIIKQYNFCKKFNIPPYPSLQETPITTIDNFNVIDSEIENYKNRDNDGSK